MIAPQREHPEAAQQIEVTVALGVEQVGSLGAHVIDGEAERAQDPNQLRIEMALEQRELIGAPLLDQLCQIDRHRCPRMFPEGRS